MTGDGRKLSLKWMVRLLRCWILHWTEYTTIGLLVIFMLVNFANGCTQLRNALKIVILDLPAEFTGWTTDRHEQYAIDAAWNNVEIALNIYEQKRNFKNNIDQYTQNAMVSKLEN